MCAPLRGNEACGMIPCPRMASSLLLPVRRTCGVRGLAAEKKQEGQPERGCACSLKAPDLLHPHRGMPALPARPHSQEGSQLQDLPFPSHETTHSPHAEPCQGGTLLPAWAEWHDWVRAEKALGGLQGAAPA